MRQLEFRQNYGNIRNRKWLQALVMLVEDTLFVQELKRDHSSFILNLNSQPNVLDIKLLQLVTIIY